MIGRIMPLMRGSRRSPATPDLGYILIYACTRPHDLVYLRPVTDSQQRIAVPV